MIIIYARRNRSARVFGSQSVTLYLNKTKKRVFHTWRMVDAQAIARMWTYEHLPAHEIAKSWRATYRAELEAEISARVARRQQILHAHG